MPAPAHLLRPVAQRYAARFGQPVPPRLIRNLPMARLMELIQRSLQSGQPISRNT